MFKKILTGFIIGFMVLCLVPNVVFAEQTIPDSITIKSVVPEDRESAILILDYYIYSNYNNLGFDSESLSADFTECTLINVVDNTNKKAKINYEYDKDVKK